MAWIEAEVSSLLLLVVTLRLDQAALEHSKRLEMMSFCSMGSRGSEQKSVISQQSTEQKPSVEETNNMSPSADQEASVKAE